MPIGLSLLHGQRRRRRTPWFVLALLLALTLVGIFAWRAHVTGRDDGDGRPLPWPSQPWLQVADGGAAEGGPGGQGGRSPKGGGEGEVNGGADGGGRSGGGAGTAAASPTGGRRDPLGRGSPAEAAAVRRGPERLSFPIRGSLSAALAALLPEKQLGIRLAQVVARQLVWWIDVRADFRPADYVDLLYSLPEVGEPVLHALAYYSDLRQRSFRAYRFQPAGAAFARYYDDKGDEIELRLRDSPIRDYEQVTSLLRDGRNHQGVDFKAPVGTPVLAPFDGVVTRTQFGGRNNGNCLELRQVAGGRRAMFLHLASLAPGSRPGVQVRKGQEIARAGNSGRSMAPHLHYQLLSARGEVLDPFEAEPTVRELVPRAALAAFRLEVQRLENLLAPTRTAGQTRPGQGRAISMSAAGSGKSATPASSATGVWPLIPSRRDGGGRGR